MRVCFTHNWSGCVENVPCWTYGMLCAQTYLIVSIVCFWTPTSTPMSALVVMHTLHLPPWL